MSIHMILGPMFAGKSTELLRLGKRNELAGRGVLYVKHALDQKRAHTARIETHDGRQSGKDVLLAVRLLDVYEQMTEERVNVICVDEGQFFSDLDTVLQLVVNKHGKHVIVAALSATFTREMFPSVAGLLPHAQRVDWLNAVCFHCGSDDASFTHRFLPTLTERDNKFGLEREVTFY